MNDDDNAQKLLDHTTKELKRRLIEAEKLVIARQGTKDELDNKKGALKVLVKTMEGINHKFVP